MKLLDRLLGRDSLSSRDVAKERLRLVLAYDRAEISPGLLATLKDELIETISRHVDIDAAGVEVTLSQTGRHSRLIADIPLLSAQHTAGGARG
jgi:cell division topological specificity factor